MGSGLEFRRREPTVSTEDVRAAVVALGLPAGRGWSDDLAIMQIAGAGLSLNEEQAKRFAALRRAVTSEGFLNLSLQLALLDVLKALAEQPAPALQHYTPSPDDFCRTCNGGGKLREPGERGVIITSDCWACGGRGTGR